MAVVVLFVAVLSFQPAAAAPNAAVTSFATEIASLLAAGDLADIPARSAIHEVTCPTVENLPGNACEGRATGTAAQGYLVGPMFGGADYTSSEGYVAFLREQVAALGAGTAKVFTIATGGTLMNARTCAGCYSVVVSTPEQAARSDGKAHLLVFDVATIEGSLKVWAVSGGLVDDIAGTALQGGTIGHLPFEPLVQASPSPHPPAVGSGVAVTDRRAVPLVFWGAGLVATALIAAAVAYSVGGRERGVRES